MFSNVTQIVVVSTNRQFELICNLYSSYYLNYIFPYFVFFHTFVFAVLLFSSFSVTVRTTVLYCAVCCCVIESGNVKKKNSRWEIAIHWHRWLHASTQHPANWPASTNWTVHSFILASPCWCRIKPQLVVIMLATIRPRPRLKTARPIKHVKCHRAMPKKKKKNEVCVLEMCYYFMCLSVGGGRYDKHGTSWW